MADESCRLVRVVGPDFVAGFETDGTVRRAAPILKTLLGMSDAEARELGLRQGHHHVSNPAYPGLTFVGNATTSPRNTAGPKPAQRWRSSAAISSEAPAAMNRDTRNLRIISLYAPLCAGIRILLCRLRPTRFRLGQTGSTKSSNGPPRASSSQAMPL